MQKDVCKVTYVARNVIDGETYKGSAAELAKRLRVTTTRIYHASSNMTLIFGMWEVEKVQETGEEKSYSRVAFMEEWDRVTTPFKVLSRRKAARANKIVEIAE